MRCGFEMSDVVRTATMLFDVVAMSFDVDRANIGKEIEMIGTQSKGRGMMGEVIDD